jgi:hypothetical protein
MRVPHTITPLVSDGVPERHIILDTEAHRAQAGGGERQTFALAATSYLRISGEPLCETVRDRLYYDPQDLWREVLDFMRYKHRTVLWAHNLAYDLRIGQALTILPRLGLDLDGIVLDYTSAWAAFSGGHRTLLCCDLTSWLPTTLERIGKDLNLHQHPNPRAGDGDRSLAVRCARDVEITSKAVQDVLQLVRTERLGPWRATGAGQSHAGWRRSFFSTGPFCHDREDALRAERRAMWTGRCEAWRWGVIKPGPSFEYDLSLAYPSITATEACPERLAGTLDEPDLSRLTAMQDRYAVLADVLADIDAPVLPHSHQNLIHWPEGRVESVIWDPELSLVRDFAHRLSIRRAYLYHRGEALQPFSQWLVAQVDGGEGEHTPVQRRALKHMSRAFIGRFALRYRHWEQHARMPDERLKLGESFCRETGERVETLQVGHNYMTLGGHELGRDACPQITGWVMSECRRRLWKLCETAGLANVLYMDTDSLIVNATGAARLDDAIADGQAWSLRLKATHRYLRIDGPRQLHFKNTRRVAGVPEHAVETKPGVYAGELFTGLRESVANGDANAVTVTPQTWRLEGCDTRREHLPDGHTRPHRVGLPDER